ncbi:hypothetical protein RZN05_11135 [Sphingomonas sp. HF-S4]|uniref:Uncharacterized protein n=1 Tax=Sphingomonas agrestis TaxID=3080540 RepID=A0ABU3Y847_9SPHN|nr:hypothetical protein [Sphingomonas sp. HF-S4]MDV3457539.1 hypothetical protein [Sphingomonas sp. HF-S4]
MHHENHVFEAGTLALDGDSFTNCTFQDIVLQYSGGPVTMVNCNFNRFSFQFGGDLAQGLHILHQLFGTEGMFTILRGHIEPGIGGEVPLPPKN